MKRILFLLVASLLAGCSSVSPSSQSGSSTVAVTPAPTYEHQLEYVEAEGATAFLRLVEVSDP